MRSNFMWWVDVINKLRACSKPNSKHFSHSKQCSISRFCSVQTVNRPHFCPFHVDNNLIYLNMKNVDWIEYKKNSLVFIWSNTLRILARFSLVTFPSVEKQRVAWCYAASNSSQSKCSYVFNQLYRLIWEREKSIQIWRWRIRSKTKQSTKSFS